MKRIIYIQLFLILIVGIFSCAPKQGIKEDTSANKEEAVIISEKTTEEAPIIKEIEMDKSAMIDGYRIKATVATTIEQINEIEKDITDALNEPVYYEFVVDKYIIYVGDCQTKEEANELKAKLKKLGYTRIYAMPRKVYKRYNMRKVENTSEATETVSSEATSSSNEIISEKMVGYRVQLFAGQNKEGAEKVREMAKDVTNFKIYILLASDDLYKVQVGDFKSKIDAEALRGKLVGEFKGAFIAKAYINCNNTTTVAEEAQSSGFFIQIGAFSSRPGAEQYQSMAKEMNFTNCIIKREDELYKVLVGSFETRENAETAKENLITSGFEGAWILEK